VNLEKYEEGIRELKKQSNRRMKTLLDICTLLARRSARSGDRQNALLYIRQAPDVP